MSDDLRVTGTVTIPASDLSWRAVRASGPGGQNVNKVSSKVDLRFDLRGTGALPADAKTRLRHLPGVRLDSRGRVVVVSQVTRDQARNLADARERLAALLRRALIRPKKRKPTKPTRGSARRRLESKRQQGEKKRMRGRVRGDD